jgi:hypothetical protein
LYVLLVAWARRRKRKAEVMSHQEEEGGGGEEGGGREERRAVEFHPSQIPSQIVPEKKFFIFVTPGLFCFCS